MPAPVISAGPFPNSGPFTGGTQVSIFGSNFSNFNGPNSQVTQVTFDGIPSPSFFVEGDGRLVCVVPDHSAAPPAAPVPVAVTNGVGGPIVAATQFTYAAVPPSITNLFPTFSPLTGGTPVFISGANFVKVQSVLFDGIQTIFTVRNEHAIIATAPAHAQANNLDVRVQAASGLSPIVAQDQFAWFPLAPLAPTITSIDPSAGSITGGTVITICGTNFTNDTQVLFGGVPAVCVFVNSPTSITAISPARSTPGQVQVTVQNSTGGVGSQPFIYF